MQRSPAVGSGPRRPSRHWPSGARRRSSRPSSGSAWRPSDAAASSCWSSSIATGVVVNPMLTGRFQLAAPGMKLPTKTAVVLGFGPRDAPPTDAARLDEGRDVAPRRRRRRRGALPGPHPDGQGLPAAGRGGSAGRGARWRRAGPGRGRPGADPRCLARADPAAPGRAQEPAPEPDLRRGHRQCLQRRDRARGGAAAVPQAGEPGRRGGRHAVRRDAVDARPTRSTSFARACLRRSRRRSGTSSRSTTRAASRVRAAGRASPRSRRVAS